MNIYTHPDGQAVESFYGDLLSQFDQFSAISEHLAALANRMWEDVQEQKEVLLKEISNYHPKFIGWKIEELRAKSLIREDCRIAIAFEYGFEGWGMSKNGAG